MKMPETRTALVAIAVLLAAHLFVNLADNFVQPAWAASTVDCRIVDINTYDKLPVKIADIDTSDTLNVKIERITSSYDAIPVKMVDWEERDAVKVKIEQ